MFDGSGSSSAMKGHLSSSIAAAAALAGLAELASAAAAISTCVPIRLSVVYRVEDPSPAAPPSDSVVGDVGLFVFSTAEGDDLAIVSVPGFDRDKLVSVGCFAGEQIDLANSDVAAFVAALQAGIFADPFGADLLAARAAYLRIEG